MDSHHIMIYQNLVLLTKSFPKLDMESKLQKDMFKKPNTKGMQSVFYSMMCILDNEYCRKNVPWPVNFRTDNFKFRTAVIDFINKECPDFEAPALLPSLLNKADGSKYVKFVFNFVTYVTKIVLNKKFGKLSLLANMWPREEVLEKPDANINCEENTNIFDAVISSTFEESKRYLEENKEFLQSSKMIYDASASELQSKLKEYHTKRQMCAGLHDISYTETMEDSALESVIKSFEDDLQLLKNRFDRVQARLHSKLQKQEHLLELLRLKQKTNVSIVDVNTLKSYMNENFAKIVQTQLPVVQSSLFVNNDEICLKTYLLFGHRIIRKHIERISELIPTNQHLAIYETVNDISTSSEKRLEALKHLESELNNIIEEAKSSIPKQKKQQKKKSSSNDALVDAFMTLRYFENYYPNLESCTSRRPLFHSTEKKHEDCIEKVKKRMELVKWKSSS